MSLRASWADHKSKKLSFWSAFSLILHNKNELFLDQIVKCDEKWILYDNWNYQLSGWTKKKFQSTSKSQTCSKKGHGHCLVVCYDFLNSSKIITSEKYAEQTDEPHWKPQGLQPALIDRKGPILLYDNARLLVAQPTLQKLNELGYEVLPHPPYSPDLLLTDYHFFKYLNNFLQGKHFHNEQEAENAFQQFIESWSTDFYNTGISKLISRWQKCVDYNGSYFD